MKITFVKILATGLIMATLFSNCKKGDTGPQGETGAAGTNGRDGNANIKSQTSTNLTWTFNSSTKAYETNISDAAITQDIVDKGAVLVYLQDGSTSTQLPSSAMYSTTTVVFFNFEYSVGNVKISFSNSDLDNSLVPQTTTKFKIVTMSASAKAAHPELQKYEEIKNVYHISE